MASRSTSTGTGSSSAPPPITETAGAAGVREDPWLARVLERPAFAVDPGAVPPAELGPAFFYAKVPVEDVAEVRRLAEAGFDVVDVNVTLVHEDAATLGTPTGILVTDASPEHGDALLELAGSCFRYSRFHLDPLIPDTLANRVKREWLRSYLDGARGAGLLAALADGRPIGFLAVLAAGDDHVIDLVGVDDAHQGVGVGGALVSTFVERYAPRSARLRVGTQVANVPSLRLYERHGFRTVSAAFVLHLHRS